MEKICCIFGAGEYGTAGIGDMTGRFVIAADGGYAHLKAQGITPALAVGDFDSLGFVPTDTEVIRHPVCKDDTDMLLAVREGFARGYRTFVIYGALGGRLDHTYANLQVLTFIAKRGGTGFLVGADTTATVLAGGTVRFPAAYEGTVSVFCVGGSARGVSERGLLYTLDRVTLTDDMPLGISNEFTGAAAEIQVEEGHLLLLWQGNLDKELPACYK